MTFLSIIMDGGNKAYFEFQVGEGYDRFIFNASRELDDYELICGHCGESTEMVDGCTEGSCKNWEVLE